MSVHWYRAVGLAKARGRDQAHIGAPASYVKASQRIPLRLS